MIALGAAILLGALASPVLAAPPPIQHPTEGREACSTCHQPGVAGPKGSPADHLPFPDTACLGCHSVGAAQPEPTKPSARSTTAPARTTSMPAQSAAPTSPVPPAPTPKPGADPKTSEPMPVGAESCLLCHDSPNLTKKLPSGERLSVYIDGAKMAQSVHGQKLQCVDCHTSLTTFPHAKVDAKSAREFRVKQTEACKRCHATIYDTYMESVHGRALKAENNGDVPLCGDCHGTHATTKDTDTPTFRLDSPKMCATCHADPSIMSRYGLSPGVYKTYSQDFHGATVLVAQKELRPHRVDQAVCYDCHGVHDVKSFRSGDPAKMREAVLAACQKCHPSAGESFPQAWLGHYELSFEQAPLAWFVRAWYIVFIPFMVGGMAIHIGADLYRSRRRK